MAFADILSPFTSHNMYSFVFVLTMPVWICLYDLASQKRPPGSINTKYGAGKCCTKAERKVERATAEKIRRVEAVNRELNDILDALELNANSNYEELQNQVGEKRKRIESLELQVKLLKEKTTEIREWNREVQTEQKRVELGKSSKLENAKAENKKLDEVIAEKEETIRESGVEKVYQEKNATWNNNQVKRLQAQLEKTYVANENKELQLQKLSSEADSMRANLVAENYGLYKKVMNLESELRETELARDELVSCNHDLQEETEELIEIVRKIGIESLGHTTYVETLTKDFQASMRKCVQEQSRIVAEKGTLKGEALLLKTENNVNVNKLEKVSAAREELQKENGTLRTDRQRLEAASMGKDEEISKLQVNVRDLKELVKLKVKGGRESDDTWRSLLSRQDTITGKVSRRCEELEKECEELRIGGEGVVLSKLQDVEPNSDRLEDAEEEFEGQWEHVEDVEAEG